MLKFLTEEEKVMVHKEYARRRAVVVLLALIIILVVGIVGILPSYLLSDYRQKEVSERTHIDSTTLFGGDELALQEWFRDFNFKLEALANNLDQERPSNFIEEVIKHKTDDVRITGFAWSEDRRDIELSVRGVTNNRQALISFEKSINDSKHFSDVDLPISDLAQGTDIDFNITFSLNRGTFLEGAEVLEENI